MASSSTPKPKLYITCNLQTKIKTQCTLYKMSSLISHRALLGVVQLKCTMYNIKARQQVKTSEGKKYFFKNSFEKCQNDFFKFRYA